MESAGIRIDRSVQALTLGIPPFACIGWWPTRHIHITRAWNGTCHLGFEERELSRYFLNNSYPPLRLISFSSFSQCSSSFSYLSVAIPWSGRQRLKPRFFDALPYSNFSRTAWPSGPKR